ncbi:hypothetical protein OHA72_56865 [Dactylosporangium sp. NBC_01737]|uniref:hypothetical protein n=1 Tax=Dactylosporangium sp. NBC_01737 TaxID=2975959 RepID=UPI002E0F1A35|nr:hypothetical protein OHA72_56865 [Dactylosporangium sp. NBC_01737]
MIFTALLALTYVVLIARQLRSLGDGGEQAAGAAPRRTVWLAARFGQMPEAVPVDRRRARAESDAVQLLVRGELSQSGYLAAMAELAARDAVEHPLDVPTSR